MKTTFQKLNPKTLAKISLMLLASSMQTMAAGGEWSVPQVKVDLTVLYRNENLRVKNAYVELVNKKTGLIEFYSTDASGNALVLLKPNATYELNIGKNGLKNHKIKMTVGDISEPVTYTEVIMLRDEKKK